jgi:hypothetical protein
LAASRIFSSKRSMSRSRDGCADAIELFQPPEQIENGFLAHAPASDTALVIPAS